MGGDLRKVVWRNRKKGAEKEGKPTYVPSLKLPLLARKTKFSHISEKSNADVMVHRPSSLVFKDKFISTNSPEYKRKAAQLSNLLALGKTLWQNVKRQIGEN